MSNLGDVSLSERGRTSTSASGSTSRTESDTLSILLAEVLLPILERVNNSLDELEQAVARIVEAPHGRDKSHGKINVDWFQCRDCLVNDGLNEVPEEWRTPCSECLDQVS